jgi:hypothetical protein
LQDHAILRNGSSNLVFNSSLSRNYPDLGEKNLL